jgi:dihydroorotate dehydrogenase subfamily 1
MDVYDLCGLRLRSPLVVGSGLVTDNERNLRKYLRQGAGAVVTKTIHPRPPRGNREKVISIATGWLNSTTYSQRSIEDWLQILRRLALDRSPVMASIHADCPSELATLAVRVADTGCQSLELGISCLNEDEGLIDTPERVARYTREVRRAVDLPFSVKLSLGDMLDARVAAAVSEGADAITLSDTILGVSVEPLTSSIRLGGAFGYSGPGIKPLVLASIFGLRRSGVSVPIFGSGGVMTAADCMEYLSVGANAVQIYSVLHSSNDAVTHISTDLSEFLKERAQPLEHVIGSSHLTLED